MTGPIRVIVADDEPIVRAGIVDLLSREPDIVVVAEARHGRELIDQVERLHPDLIFLDVQMPEQDGLAAAAALPMERRPGIVFVTAFSEYAVEAFEHHAIDYLLKPFDGDRFRVALQRARERLRARREANAADRPDLGALLEQIGAGNRPLTRFLIKLGSRATIVAAGDVDWLEAADNYVRLHAGTTRHLIRMTLKQLEQRLDPATFVRVHRSAMVNLNQVREVRWLPTGDGEVLLRSGAKVAASRRHRADFEARFLG